MDLAGLAWPLASTAFGALMFAVCTYRRNRVCSHAVAALECAHATMLAIESGDQEEGRSVVDSGPFAEQLETITAIGRHLAARTRNLSAIIEAQPECVKIVDAEGRLVQMNPAGLEMIAATSLSQVRGAKIEDLIVEEHRKAYREMHASVLQGQTGSLTFEALGLNGQHLWFETNAVPLADRTGQIVQLGVTRDITERKRHEEAIHDAQARAESANRSKSEFLANMSHELRTPLTAIIGFSDLLAEEEGLGADQHSALESIHSSAEHLLALINDVLDVSKIEAGQVEVEHITFELRDLIKRTVQPLRHGVMEAGLTLNLKWDEGVPATIKSDPTKIRQVITNLLSNATKFSTQGGIEVVVSSVPSPSSAELTCLTIAVSDTGIGIPESSLERIFSPFEQAEASTTREFGGTGLGLSISREIARRMGGDLTVESEVDRGSTFTLSLPLVAAQGPQAPASEPQRGSRFQGRILVVEDNVINVRVLCELLRRRGLEVETSDNGSDGFQQAMAAAGSDRAFDLVLLDMYMPIQDGFTTARKLKDAGHIAPVVALTASAMAEDQRRCLDAGCDDYLAKPIDNGLLDALLSKYLEMAPALEP